MLVGSHVVVPAGYVSVRRVSHADKKNEAIKSRNFNECFNEIYQLQSLNYYKIN